MMTTVSEINKTTLNSVKLYNDVLERLKTASNLDLQQTLIAIHTATNKLISMTNIGAKLEFENRIKGIKESYYKKEESEKWLSEYKKLYDEFMNVMNKYNIKGGKSRCPVYNTKLCRCKSEKLGGAPQRYMGGVDYHINTLNALCTALDDNGDLPKEYIKEKTRFLDEIDPTGDIESDVKKIDHYMKWNFDVLTSLEDTLSKIVGHSDVDREKALKYNLNKVKKKLKNIKIEYFNIPTIVSIVSAAKDANLDFEADRALYVLKIMDLLCPRMNQINLYINQTSKDILVKNASYDRKYGTKQDDSD